MYPQVQDTLRQKLQTAYEGSEPSTAEIIDTDIPYLDAVVEETVRVSVTAGIIGRRATVDTEVLGCPIPKGTNVILNTRLSRPLPAEKGGVSEELRSATSRAAHQKRTRGGLYGYSGKNLDVFEPRRWLTRDESGREVFDAYALPALVFGGGLRGCFGKPRRNGERQLHRCNDALTYTHRQTAGNADPAHHDCPDDTQVRVLAVTGRVDQHDCCRKDLSPAEAMQSEAESAMMGGCEQ
jgi:hypothetical protein